MWDENKYKEFLKELYSNQDIEYQRFSRSLLPNDYNKEFIGIRIPILKLIARRIAKEDYISFIQLNTHNTFEEIMIHGLIIGYIKEDINKVIDLYKDYIQYIGNWSLCDTTSNNLKIIRKYPNEGIKLVKWCLKHKKTYYKRVGYVILLNYYVNDKYLDYIFDECNNNDNDDYYVKMAVAWLICECFTKYPDKTISYIKNNKLDTWTHNKAIQKIRESNRVDNNTKKELLNYKKID